MPNRRQIIVRQKVPLGMTLWPPPKWQNISRCWGLANNIYYIGNPPCGLEKPWILVCVILQLIGPDTSLYLPRLDGRIITKYT